MWSSISCHVRNYNCPLMSTSAPFVSPPHAIPLGTVVILCLTGALSFALSMAALTLGLCCFTIVRALALSTAVKHMQQLYGDALPISLADLQLTLVDRDFTALDYEALVALDESTPVHPASDAQLASLPIHYMDDSCSPTPPCCVCLEGYTPGTRVLTLPACGHVFHAQCATSWVQCRGTSVRCPLCNVPVFDKCMQQE